MAVTMTWEVLRDLATLRSGSGCAISLYLDLDPSVSPTPAAVASRINAHLDAIEKSVGSGELGHDQKEGLRADLERLRTFFDSEFSREGAHGFAVFSAGLDGGWAGGPAKEELPGLGKGGKALYLAPLVPLVP